MIDRSIYGQSHTAHPGETTTSRLRRISKDSSPGDRSRARSFCTVKRSPMDARIREARRHPSSAFYSADFIVVIQRLSEKTRQSTDYRGGCRTYADRFITPNHVVLLYSGWLTCVVANQDTRDAVLEYRLGPRDSEYAQ